MHNCYISDSNYTNLHHSSNFLNSIDHSSHSNLSDSIIHPNLSNSIIHPNLLNSIDHPNLLNNIVHFDLLDNIVHSNLLNNTIHLSSLIPILSIISSILNTVYNSTHFLRSTSTIDTLSSITYDIEYLLLFYFPHSDTSYSYSVK